MIPMIINTDAKRVQNQKSKAPDEAEGLVESNQSRRRQYCYLSTGMVSSWLDNPHISVLVWMGTLGSFPISSSLEMTIEALTDGGSLLLESMVFMLSALRLMFLGTESSLTIRSSTSTHCFMTSFGFVDTVITSSYVYKTSHA